VSEEVVFANYVITCMPDYIEVGL